ncbi:U-box domain-containing protein 27 [Carica papaya]|uniref:U-box domain-containing protein 27 n=1 Tax=Carica papaya TaxID=3649 RepID=UPI000B8CF227|nr:U-box domain-containing protein 27 [Carica papaya]
MVRDDLYITIPTFFRCPISLDVMKSPVSLCTGVTYDRASIQRWLDNGNNTCPATMQVLQSKEFVPNRTLQRLIQIWSDSVRHRVDSPDSIPASAPTQDQVKLIMRDFQLKNNDADHRLHLLSKIVLFARESEENRDFLAKTEQLVPLLVDLICNVDGKSPKNIQIIEQVLRILDVIRTKIGDREQLSNLIMKSDRDCLTAILLALQQGSVDSKIESVRVLEYVAIDAQLKLVIAERKGLLQELMKSVRTEADPSLIEATLSCLIAIAVPKRVRVSLVRMKVVTELKKLLTEPNSSVAITEKVLKLLEMVSSCKEGRGEICEDSGCVQGILQKVLKVSNTATDHAVTILWSVCYLFRDQRAQEAVASSNGMTKILLLMQSNCSPSVRQMSADLLKVFRVNSKSCLSSYDTKTTHIMPF